MAAIEELVDPYQRTAMLLRWSGARGGEIRRLSIDRPGLASAVAAVL